MRLPERLKACPAMVLMKLSPANEVSAARLLMFVGRVVPMNVRVSPAPGATPLPQFAAVPQLLSTELLPPHGFAPAATHCQVSVLLLVRVKLTLVPVPLPTLPVPVHPVET